MHAFRTLTIAVALAACADAAGQRTPPLANVGVIEGFYGEPWSHRDRLDMLEFMGRVGLAAYYYAPKDDPYHRSRWREPYPPAQLARLRELVETARANDVAFHYAISPGETMVYSDTAEYRTLLGKLDVIAGLGVTQFALFLDDVPPHLEHARDRLAYPSLAAAHADLINRLHRALGERGFTLSVTPTTYTNAWGDTAYVRELGERADSGVAFFWTGIDVVAPEITAPQAREWAVRQSRAPLVWDNYPVNDFARWRPFLGPVRGRAPDLATAIAGLMANPMNEAHASMLPLATVAEWARAPGSYDPDASVRRAAEALYGPGAMDLLEPLLAVWGDYPWDENVFEPLYILEDSVDVAAIEGAVRRAQEGLARLRLAAGDRPALAPLVDDLTPFVRRTADRLRALESDPGYVRHGAALIYRSARDRIAAPRARATVDGNLDEWRNADWRSLAGPSGVEAPRVAFAHDGDTLYVALSVGMPPRRVLQGDRMGEGDHIALVLQHDTVPGRTRLSPNDLVVLLPPPGERAPTTPLVRALNVHGFMAKWPGDDRGLTFSQFVLSSLGTPPAAAMRPVADGLTYRARRSGAGYTAELAVPLRHADVLRLALTVSLTRGERRHTFSVSQRNYPANPVTFAELRLAR